MHGSFDKSGKADKDACRSIGFLALPALIVMALIGIVTTRPAASNWISQAAEAEFVGTDLVPDVAPIRLAKPAMEIRTVKAKLSSQARRPRDWRPVRS
jgi:hypothetical protein